MQRTEGLAGAGRAAGRPAPSGTPAAFDRCRAGSGAGGREHGGAHDPRRRGHHAYNAVLKRVLGKGRAEMELEAAVAWLGRNRLRDHLGLLDGNARHAWNAGRRGGGWTPPIGRVPKARGGPAPARRARRSQE